MSDKDVTRNVRGSGEDGIATARDRHYHALAEKGNLTFDKKAGSQGAERQALLARFKEREMKRRQAAGEGSPTDGAPAPSEPTKTDGKAGPGSGSRGRGSRSGKNHEEDR